MRQQLRLFEFPPYKCNTVAVGITAFVGIVGGIYYLTQNGKTLLRKIVEKKEKRATDIEEICNVCCADIQIDDIKSFVTCCTCQKRICRGIKCADWIPKTAQWECRLCHTSKESLAQTSSWVAEQMSFSQQKMIYPMRARSEIFIPIGDFHDGCMNFESVSQTGGNSAIITAEQKIQLREYVEEIVASLLGGSLDKINVGKLSKSENYLPAIINGRSQSLEPDSTTTATSATTPIDIKNSGDLSNISHARLRQMIESIIAETLRTPNLLNGNAISELSLDTRHHNHHHQHHQQQSNGVGDVLVNGHAKQTNRRHRTEHYFEPRIYQDLLATAVLNKIVDTHGNNNARRVSESTPDLSGNGQRDANFNVENQSTTSCSSVEPRSDCSSSDNEQMGNVDRNVELTPNGSRRNLEVDNSLTIGRESVLSDYIATHMVPLPDLSAAATESGSDDQASASSSTLAEGTWEDNWLFKKRDSSMTATVSGSAMLVPAPKEDIRAQIGDKAADEVSDLSEMGSETDDSSLDLIRASMDPMNERVLNKHLIGGQNTKMALDELVECASVSPTIETNIAETKNPNVKETTTISQTATITPVESASVDEKRTPLTDQLSTDSNESTPTMIESYSATQLNNEEIIDKLNCKELTTNQNATNEITNHGKCTNKTPILTHNDAIVESSQDVDDDIAVLRRFVPGSIAEREYKKWYNAVDMPNNPYSAEALKKRISGSQERIIDLPNISPNVESNPIAGLPDAEIAGTQTEIERDAKRYSRDYYINDGKNLGSPTKSPQHAASPKPVGDLLEDDIIINEKAKNASEIAKVELTNIQKVEKIETSANELYQAIPVQVIEDLSYASSYETQSNPNSLQSVNTTTSDDSDTVRVYDFTKQETTVIRPAADESNKEFKEAEQETATDAPPATTQILKKARPGDLKFATTGAGQSLSAAGSPFGGGSRGSTPTAFKFLQPKRKLIDPSQVMSFDEDDAMPSAVSTPGDKPAIEEEIARAMPSVRALAQAFLSSSGKSVASGHADRWLARTKSAPATPKKPLGNVKKFETSPTVAEPPTEAENLTPAESTTITSSSETLTETKENQSTVPTKSVETTTVTTTSTPPASDEPKRSISSPLRAGFLKSNIAFFENLKFKK